jgi:hypothetical protein
MEDLVFTDQNLDSTVLSLNHDSHNPLFYGYDPFAINVGGIVNANGGLDVEGITWRTS